MYNKQTISINKNNYYYYYKYKCKSAFCEACYWFVTILVKKQIQYSALLYL